MKKIFFLMLTLLIWSTTSMNAQVRIGGLDDPDGSAVLDLNVSDDAEPEGNLGLSLPRVKLTSAKQWLIENQKPKDGTLIYNTNVDFARGRGIYFWTDSIWFRATSSSELLSGDTVAFLQKPVVKVISSPEEGLSASFGLDNYLDNGSTYRYDWTVTASGSPEYSLDPEYSSTKREVITVPYDDVARYYTVNVKARADGYNDSPVSDDVTTGNPGSFRPSYDLLGESYYDIAVTEYNSEFPNYPYGILAYRKPFALDPTQTYTYEIVGKGDSPTYSWSVTEGGAYLSNAADINSSTDASVNVQFVDLSENLTIVGEPDANLTVTLQCRVTDADGRFAQDYTKTIEIGDRDACIPTIGLTDAEGHKYTVYRFGDSGCWMTQNLRSTKTMQNGIEVLVPEDKNAGNFNVAAWYYPNGDAGRTSNLIESNPEYGLLYSWSAANIGTAATESSDAFKSEDGEGMNSDRQGICPAGWVVPSDWDWAMLEKEIASHPQYYSTQTSPYADADTYDFYTGNTDWRPSTGAASPTWWGRQMKSTTLVSTTVTNGSSNTDGYGFNALLVGILVSGSQTYYGTGACLWSSSSASSSTMAWRRYMSAANSGASRATTNKYRLLSVRCKKLE
jgi:uncharacterized protein (TIGR02145 family)